MHGVTTACYFQQDNGVQILAHCALTFMRAWLGADLGPPDQGMTGYQAIPDNVTTQIVLPQDCWMTSRVLMGDYGNV